MKIEPSAQQLLTALRQNWDKKLERTPLLELDGNWPSVATLDLISFGARLEKQPPRGMETMLKGCACYLAQIVGTAWSQIAEQVVVSYSQETGVIVRALNSKYFAEGDSLTFPAEQALRHVIEDLPDPFTIVRGSTRRISFETNVISLLAIGACLGLHPSVTGAWEKKSFADLKEPLQEITKELARQTSEYYARVFPKEPLGSVAEIYLSSLIFPPLFIGEPLPGMLAIQNIFDFAKRYNISRAQLCRVGSNWARLADDTLSAVGLVLYASCVEGQPAADMLAAAQGKFQFMGLLRPALVEARRLLADEDEPNDWLQNGIRTKEQLVEFEVDTQMLFLPWVTLTSTYIRKNFAKVSELLKHLAEFDFAESVTALDALISEDPSDLELRLQRIKLEMVQGDWDKADSMFRGLLSESGADESALFFHLWTLTSLAKGDSNAALRYCKAAIAVCPTDSPLYPELLNNCGWSTLMLGDIEDSLRFFEEGLTTAQCPLTLLLNKAHVLWRLNRQPEVRDIKDQLLSLAPVDRRVFISAATDE